MTWPGRSVLDLVNEVAGGVLTAEQAPTGPALPGARSARQGSGGLAGRRLTGVLPNRAEIRYPSRVQLVPVTEDGLRQTEDNLRVRLERITQALRDRPASPRPGEHCPQCDVRPFCDSYWVERSQLPSLPARNQKRPVDLEMLVTGVPTQAGFEASLANDQRVPVVFEEGCQAVFAPIALGERLRVLGAQLDATGAIELKLWTEVFHLAASSG